jgi:class 3 adenylate cyclase
MGILFAATHPERTDALVLVNTGSRVAQGAADNVEETSREEFFDRLERSWGTGSFLGGFGDMAVDPGFVRWLARAQRLTAPPGDHAWRIRSSFQIDLRPALAAVRVPTLVVANRGTPGFARCRDDAERIDGARFVGIEGDAALSFMTDPDPIVDAIEEFVTGRLPVPVIDRVLATVLFTDVVASTEHAARLGDRRWRHLLADHNAAVRSQLERFRGREVKTVGDGFLATFDGPGRAIRCAAAIRDAVCPLGIDLRVGLHSGEVELIGEDIAGIAVHIGQRVSALAGPGEVLVSSTVKDLVVGSGIAFDDRGDHQLKGVPGTWRVFAVKA